MRRPSDPNPESGNIVFFILLAIALIALVTAAIEAGSDGRGDVDREAVTLSVSKVEQYAAELERGVVFVLNNGASETDIRFASPQAPADYGVITDNPQFQIFSAKGGGVAYKMPPMEVQTTPGPWEFYGTTALPNVGSDKAELMAVLPNVTKEFCDKINAVDGFDAGVVPTDSAACLYTGAAGRFNSETSYNDSTANTVDATKFPASRPMLDGCVLCADGSRQYYHVLHVR